MDQKSLQLQQHFTFRSYCSVIYIRIRQHHPKLLISELVTGNAFINISASWNSVSMKLTSISLSCWASRTINQRTSMCLVHWWNIELWIKKMVSWLSHRSGMVKSVPLSFEYRRSSHITSSVLYDDAMKSDSFQSFLGNAIKVWLRLSHKMGPTLRKNMAPDVDRWSCRSPA